MQVQASPSVSWVRVRKSVCAKVWKHRIVRKCGSVTVGNRDRSVGDRSLEDRSVQNAGRDLSANDMFIGRSLSRENGKFYNSCHESRNISNAGYVTRVEE